MPITRKRWRDEKMNNMDPSPSHSKMNMGTRKRRKGYKRRNNINNFVLGRGSNAYNLAANVSAQGTFITWPQLLYLLPKLCHQWSKMMSTKKDRIGPVNLISFEKIANVYCGGLQKREANFKNLCWWWCTNLHHERKTNEPIGDQGEWTFHLEGKACKYLSQ